MISPDHPGSAAPCFETHGLSVHFGDRSAIEDISISALPGERVSLVGPNGAGKSTLLKAIAGIVPASHGEILLNGQPTFGPDARVVYVPQRSAVDWSFPCLVIDVVLMARNTLRSRWLPFGDADRAAALDALTAVGLQDQAHVQVGKLSGGQQQRMFLARALLQKGNLYLLDEPFTGVDVPTQELVSALFQDLGRQGKTIIFATHDLDQAEHAADRVLMLNRRLITAGPPSEVMTGQALRQTFGSEISFAPDRQGTAAP